MIDESKLPVPVVSSYLDYDRNALPLPLAKDVLIRLIKKKNKPPPPPPKNKQTKKQTLSCAESLNIFHVHSLCALLAVNGKFQSLVKSNAL